MFKMNSANNLDSADQNEYALVQFIENGVLYICPRTKIGSKCGEEYYVKYSNRKNYKAKIVQFGSKTLLNKILENLKINENPKLGDGKYALVKYIEDDTYYICLREKVGKKYGSGEGIHFVEYSDKKSYVAKVIQLGEKDHLNKVLEKLNETGGSDNLKTVPLNQNEFARDVTKKDNNLNCGKGSKDNLESENKIDDLINDKLENIPNVLPRNDTKISEQEFSSDEDIRSEENHGVSTDYSDYEPSSSSSSTESQNSDDLKKNQEKDLSNSSEFLNSNCVIKKLKQSTVSAIDKNSNPLVANNLSHDHSNLESSELPNLYQITVNTAPGKPAWNKKKFCKFCLKGYPKLPRHFEQTHSNEPEIQTLMSLKKNSKERAELLNNLRATGNYLHNRLVYVKGYGEIITKKRVNPKDSLKSDSYLPCPGCKENIKNTYLYRHKLICKNKNQVVFQRNIRQQAAALIPPSIEINEKLQTVVLSRMRPDEIFRTIRNDELLLKYGVKIFQDSGGTVETASYTADKLRELGRFLREMRILSNNSTKTLRSCIKPREIKNIIAATKSLCEFSEETGKIQRPYLARKIGHALMHCFHILQGDAAENENKEELENLINFKKAYDAKWTTNISRPSLRQQRKNKKNKSIGLPLAEDIRLLNVYLQQNIKRCLSLIKNTAEPGHLTELSRLTLCLIIAFNRKRAGEAQKTKLSDVDEMKLGDLTPEIRKCLSLLEIKLIDYLTRFEITGKKNRNVPVLLTPLMREAIEILKNPIYREIMSIYKENDYLFAIPRTHSSSFRGCDVMRLYSKLCNAKFPENLRSTKLRKHLATMTQVINLDENELDVVASFMGHDIRVHREYYRLPENALQIAKFGKMITGKEKGIDFNDDDLKRLMDSEVVNFSEDEDDPQDVLDNDLHENNDDKDKVENEPSNTIMKSLLTKKTELNNEIEICKKHKKDVIKKPWSKEELSVVKSFFKSYLNILTLPSKDRFMKCIHENPILKDRKWTVIKDKLRYIQLKNVNKD